MIPATESDWHKDKGDTIGGSPWSARKETGTSATRSDWSVPPTAVVIDCGLTGRSARPAHPANWLSAGERPQGVLLPQGELGQRAAAVVIGLQQGVGLLQGVLQGVLLLEGHQVRGGGRPRDTDLVGKGLEQYGRLLHRRLYRVLLLLQGVLLLQNGEPLMPYPGLRRRGPRREKRRERPRPTGGRQDEFAIRQAWQGSFRYNRELQI